MADIIPLTTTSKEPDDQIWYCAHCSGSAFNLFANGTTECRGCGYRGEHPEGRWGEWTPVDGNEPTVRRNVALFDSAEFAQRSVIKSINADTSLLVVAADNGKIRLWSRHNYNASPEAQATVRYLLNQAASLIFGEAPLDRPDDVLEQTE